jgi:hypothetical protein
MIDLLITELVKDQFKLTVQITEKNTFSISITGMPNEEYKSYWINVDIGLLRMLYDGLYVVLSNNSIFSGLGRAFGQFDIPTLELPDWNSLDLAMANNDDVYFDVDRNNLHAFLYHLCLSFIIRHEIRHIANGHIDYLTNKLQPLFYENSKNGLDPIDSQTLEMDVDSCVFVGMIDGLLNHSFQRSKIPEALQDDRGIFMSLLFSIQFLFYCMPSRKISGLSDIESSSHPNSYLRYFFSYTAGLSFIQANYPNYVEVFLELHKNNFWEFVNNLSEKKLVDFNRIMQDYNWSVSEEGFSYANKIWDNWNNWIPKLQPFAYLKLAPPN